MGRFDDFINGCVEDHPRAMLFQDIVRQLRDHIQEHRFFNSMRSDLRREVKSLKKRNKLLTTELKQEIANVKEMHMYNAEV